MGPSEREILQTILQLLNRVEIKWAEVPAFNVSIHYLNGRIREIDAKAVAPVQEVV